MIIKVKKDFLKSVNKDAIPFMDKENDVSGLVESKEDEYVITATQLYGGDSDLNRACYDLREKEFLAANHPAVQLEEYCMRHYIWTGEERPAADCCFISDEAKDLDLDDEDLNLECISLVLEFRDYGARHDYHEISFSDIAQIYSLDENFGCYDFSIAKDIVFNACADKNGYFTVTLTFILGKAEDELLDFHDVNITVLFTQVKVSTQFAEEFLTLIGDGNFSYDGRFLPADGFGKDFSYVSRVDA